MLIKGPVGHPIECFMGANGKPYLFRSFLSVGGFLSIAMDALDTIYKLDPDTLEWEMLNATMSTQRAAPYAAIVDHTLTNCQ